MKLEQDLYLASETQAPFFLKGKNVTIGRSESCDYSLKSKHVSHIHAAIMQADGHFYISDMNSTNGVYVNGAKIVNEQLKAGDVVRLGDIVLELKRLSDQSSESGSDRKKLPKVGATTAILRDPRIQQKLRATPSSQSGKSSIIQLVPELLYSEFILDDSVQEKVFVFPKKRDGIEISTFSNNQLIDYSVLANNTRKIFISSDWKDLKSENTIVIPGELISKRELLTHSGKKWTLKNFEDLEIKRFKINDRRRSLRVEGEVNLGQDEILSITNGLSQVFIQLGKLPPATKPLGLFQYDPTFFNLVGGALVLWSVMLATLFDPSVTEIEPPKELVVKEIDRILYKPAVQAKQSAAPQMTDASENSSQVNDVSVNEPEPIKEKPKKVESQVPKPVSEPKVVKQEVKVKPKQVKPLPVKPIPQPPRVERQKQARISQTARQKIAPARQNPPAVKKPNLDKLASKYSNIFNNKDSAIKKSQTSPSESGILGSKTGDLNSSANLAKGSSRNRKNIQVSGTGGIGETKLGSLDGNVLGSLSGGSGKEVVVGSIDPYLIRRLLKEKIPNFSLCYDQELQRKGKRIAATIVLGFTIKGNAKVANDTYDSNSIQLSRKALRCFGKVLRSIRFPRPKGGGIVKVKQPINLEPKF